MARGLTRKQPAGRASGRSLLPGDIRHVQGRVDDIQQAYSLLKSVLRMSIRSVGAGPGQDQSGTALLDEGASTINQSKDACGLPGCPELTTPCRNGAIAWTGAVAIFRNCGAPRWPLTPGPSEGRWTQWCRSDQVVRWTPVKLGAGIFHQDVVRDCSRARPGARTDRKPEQTRAGTDRKSTTPVLASD